MTNNFFIMRLVLISAMLWLAGHLPAAAHEFWVMPAPFETAAGAPVHLNLYVGQFFEGDLVPFSAEYVTAFRRYSALGEDDLTSRLPRSSRGGISLPFTHPGAHLLAIDTHPNHVELSADKFNYYLAEEGLGRINQMRETAGTTAELSRERYRRHIKALVWVDGKSDDTVLMRTGQRMEIIPLADPFQKKQGDSLDFRVLFEDKPLAKVLVKAWHKEQGQTLIIRAVANEEGLVRLILPFSGAWMLSAVHMLPVTNDPKFDWESFWGNLTFQLGKTE